MRLALVVLLLVVAVRRRCIDGGARVSSFRPHRGRGVHFRLKGSS